MSEQINQQNDGQVIFTAQQASKYFGGLAAVDQVDIDIYQGEVLGLIGPNGAGKTTLVNIVTGMIGLFAVSEIFHQIAESEGWTAIRGKFSTRLPRWAELWKLRAATLIGTVVGAVGGMLPGAGGAVAAASQPPPRWHRRAALSLAP